ncbi:MAG: hypothetical protein COX90_00560 [Candidatus Nealsonbacteria bacterium CG_4_10_14_0_2_um_filter_38_17]|uniref:L,D-TPase catalytic domain-containing protein n=1 Tax=Candidatus Nealsonbacteria bacterium CG_4_10_14_0_2_um_filter_38_17 TaxID=1974680 RepID=A0A2M7UYZ6_9BACT|nr:MAG: hypothetical protein COX90_00560 [Candidatus Nealsonbacteria bacterium CG_4_10_14_0_2_um_filter_38_17]
MKLKITRKTALIAIVCILPLAVFFSVYFFRDKIWPKIPEYAKEYSVSSLSCNYQEKTCSKIKFDFAASEKSLNKIPKYSIQEFQEKGLTEIVFYNVSSVKSQFTYEEVINNPLIEELAYDKVGNDFLVKIKRKGPHLPAQVLQEDSIATINLPVGDENYPVISDQRPADNSAAYPIFRKIMFQATLKSPLKKATVLFQDNPVEFSAIETSPNQYLFSFSENIEKDKQYYVKTIITDDQDKTGVTSWTFEGQIPIEATLGPDRFKYLGWWGQINAIGVSVRKEPKSSSEKVGSFSSLNRVKVLKEVIGETINDNNLWYEIDGGRYPHSYVFSEFVTPLPQPEPPKEFTVPQEVKEGEYWIDVDLTKNVITLFLYDKPVFASYVSPGRPENPTIEGTFRVWYKLTKTRMRGGPPLHSYRYDLDNVPNVLYYEDSYAIHGTYWHDKFGTQQSAGCTNLAQGDAAFIFEKTTPILNPKQESIVSSKDNPGTVVHNHY